MTGTASSIAGHGLIGDLNTAAFTHLALIDAALTLDAVLDDTVDITAPSSRA